MKEAHYRRSEYLNLARRVRNAEKVLVGGLARMTALSIALKKLSEGETICSVATWMRIPVTTLWRQLREFEKCGPFALIDQRFLSGRDLQVEKPSNRSNRERRKITIRSNSAEARGEIPASSASPIAGTA